MMMNNNNNKIFGGFLSIILLMLIGYLTFFVNNSYTKDVPELIEVEGNNLLNGNDYIIFTKLDNCSDYKDFSEAVIKDRFEKHPYIYRADVEVTGKKTISVKANEKEIKAIIIVNSEPFLVSGDYQVLPYFQNLNSINVPVISNVKIPENLKVLSYLKNDEMIQAFKIIDAVNALKNEDIADNLSEINFKSGLGLTYRDDVVMNFSNVKPVIIFGRGNEAKKMVIFETLWNNITSGQISMNNSDYVDLRYSNDIYFGNMKNMGLIQ